MAPFPSARQWRILAHGVSGGSDDDGDAPADDAAPDPSGAPAPPGESPPPASSGDAGAESPQIGDTRPAPEQPTETLEGWKQHAIGLRQENQRYRERWQPIERAFSNLDDDVREGLLEVAGLLHEDPLQAQVALMRASGLTDQAIRFVLEQTGALGGQAAPQAASQQPQYLTPDALEEFREQLLEEFSEEQELSGYVSQVQEEAKSLGFDPGTPGYDQLLRLVQASIEANREDPAVPVLTLEQAAQQLLDPLEQYRRQAIDEYLNSKRPGASPTTGRGTAPADAKPITTLEEAQAAAEAALSARP